MGGKRTFAVAAVDKGSSTNIVPGNREDTASAATSGKIRELLGKVGITEVTYHALRRNEAISFMPRRQKGQAGFTHEQLLALKTFALLRTYGLNSRAAAEAVEASFPLMREMAAARDSSLETPGKIRVRIVASRGKLSVTHLDEVQAAGALEVGHIEFDLRSISALLAM